MSPRGSAADLATIVSGIGSLTIGAAKLMEFGGVRHTMVAMDEGSLFVMSISDGSLLGVHGSADCDMSVVAYHMALFVGRAGHVLTPELRSELRKSLEESQTAGSAR
jgi:predicted regulator of Ras-like GTPase activity (Roadblock/LC7/MglB family)